MVPLSTGRKIGREEGATLIELLVVLGIIAVMTGIGAESLVTLAARQQSRTVVTEIAAELRFARQLAIVRRERVRVVIDVERARLRTESANEIGQILREYEFFNKGMSVERLSGGPQIQFHPSGRSATATTIVLRDRQQRRRNLTVSLTGRISIL